jgi:hypothetical protein
VELQAISPGSEPPGDGREPGNLQAWAREIRYRAAERLARAVSGRYAAGHTASDQVETILYRLCASPGRRALLGMVRQEGLMIRPLLDVTREQTASYCSERGLPWREDESNEDPAFARSRVRHQLVPALRSIHPAAEANVLRTASLLREETELLDEIVAAELAGSQSIPVERLARAPAALARLLVIRLAEQATGTYAPQAGERVAEIIALGRQRRAARRRRRGSGDRGRDAPDAQAGAPRAQGDAARGLDSPAWAHQRALPSSPAWARCSSRPRNCSDASLNSASRSRRTTPVARCCSWACSRAPCSSLAT